MRYPYCILLLLAVFCFKTISAQQPDSIALNDTIKELVITAKPPNTTSISKYGEEISFTTQNLNKHAKILGNADAFRYIQLLPGVSINNDYTSGTSVQGCDFSHSIVEMDGATLFYPYHLMGIFSTCNNDHFSRVSLEKSVHSADFANRLGGKISILPQTQIPNNISAKADLGLISSGTSLSIPISSKCAVILSGRISYLNKLYKTALEDENNKIKYDFFDTNLTFIYKKDSNNTLSINTLLGQDRLSCHSKESFLDFKLGWDNFAFTATYEHSGKISHKTNVAFSGMNNKFNIYMQEFNVDIPTEISQLSIKETINTALGDTWSINAGSVFEYYKINNNSSHVEGLYNTQTSRKGYANAFETRIFGNIIFKPNKKWNLSTGIKATFYNNGKYQHVSADPHITLRFNHNELGSLALHTGIYHQYIHQAGFSSNGLPTDYWFMSDNLLPQQRAYSISASWKQYITSLDTDISAEIYYKRIQNQPELNSSVMDVLNNDFDAKNNLIESNGYNTGIDLMLQKQFGKISGWISYSLGFARRKIPELAAGYVPSSRESLHNLSITASYKHNNSFSYTANFVFASGTPTTPIKAVFMVGENILCKYGEYNSWHLPHYHRLDLSATYTFPKKIYNKFNHYLNFSIVNAYANKNVIFQYFSYTREDKTFKFKEVSTLFKVLPSISYRLEF